MAAKKGGGESKQGLIVTLVFFILSTIGLGVGTYYGFADQERLNGEIKKEKGNTEIFKDLSEYYRFQSGAYRTMLGQPGNVDATELGLAKGNFDRGALGKNAKDKDDVTNTFKELNKILPWPPGKNIPDTTYAKLLADERKRADDVEKHNKALTTDKASLQKKNQDLEDTLADAKKSFDELLIKSGTKATADLSGYLKTIDELRNQLGKLNNEKDVLIRRLDEEKNKNVKVFANLEKELKSQRDVILAKEEELSKEKKQGVGVEIPRDWRPDWRVVSIDRAGRLVYINLGWADKIQPQLTFSLHGTDQSGRPVAKSKGSLEVVTVLGEHLSQARITGLKDGNRDPVLVNDVIYHPTWSPTLKKHVAVAGMIDLTGDGKDNLQEFLRNLERQNVVVDAYQDMRDSTIKGKGMSVKTEYLILGDGPEVFSERQERDQRDFVEKLSKGMGDMQEQATKYGVKVIGLRHYLEMIGYRMPRVLADRQPGAQYRPRVTVTTDTPEDRPAPPKEKPKEDKPKEDKPAVEDKPKEVKPEAEKKP